MRSWKKLSTHSHSIFFVLVLNPKFCLKKLVFAVKKRRLKIHFLSPFFRGGCTEDFVLKIHSFYAFPHKILRYHQILKWFSDFVSNFEIPIFNELVKVVVKDESMFREGITFTVFKVKVLLRYLWKKIITIEVFFRICICLCIYFRLCICEKTNGREGRRREEHVLSHILSDKTYLHLFVSRIEWKTEVADRPHAVLSK